MNLRSRFILFFGIGGVCFLLAVTTLVFGRMEAAMTEQLKQQFQEAIQNRIANLSRDFNERTTDFKLISQLPMFKSMRFNQLTLNKAAERNNVRQLELSFLKMIRQRPEVLGVKYINQAGFEVVQVDQTGIKKSLSDISREPEIIKALNLQRGDFIINEHRKDAKAQSIEWMMPVFLSARQQFGILIFTIDFNYFKNAIANIVMSESETVCLTNANDDVLYSHNKIEACEAHHRQHEGHDWHGDGILNLPGLSWSLHFSVDSESLLSNVTELKTLVFGIIFPAIAFIFFVISYLVSNDILRAIKSLLNATQSMGRGEPLEPLDTSRNDELGQLAKEVNRSAKKIEENRGKLESDLVRLIETSHAAMISIDSDGRIDDWNQGAEQITQYPKSEVMGRDFASSLVDIEYWDTLLGVVDRTMKGDVTANTELSIRTKSDTPITLLFNLTPRFNMDGDIVGIAGVGQDITESKEFARKLERSEARFKDLANAGSDWFWEFDAGLRFSYLSDNFQEITGIDPAILMGKTRRGTGVPGVTKEYWEDYLETLDNHLPFRDFIHSRPNIKGEGEIWISNSGNPVFDEKGTFQGYRGIGSNITERKQSEDALRESENRFRDFSQSSSDWFWEMDADLRFSYFSERLQEASGWVADKLLGKTRQEIGISGVDADNWERHFTSLDRRESFRDFQYSSVHEAGRNHELLTKG